jgi:7-cyano-7-deazaguanine synthase
MTEKRAVILLSGGLDSATVVAMAKAEGYACYTMSFDYGQRHRAELNAAARVARDLGVVEHKVIGLNLDGIGGSALTDSSIDVPEAPGEGIPVTYVPARNTVFLALGWAEVLGRAISLSASMPWITPVTRIAARVCRGLRAHGQPGDQGRCGGHGFRIQAPLQNLSKAQIVQAAWPGRGLR